MMGNTIDVVYSVSNILGIRLSVIEQEAWDIQPDWVGNVRSLQQRDIVSHESDIAGISCTRDEDDGLWCIPSSVLEGGRDVDCTPKLLFA